MKKLLFVFGTRPEAIKMAPLIKECLKYPEVLNVKLCTTGQHKEMLEQVMVFFGIRADYELQLMQQNQSLYHTTANGLLKLEEVIHEVAPDVVLVQGDTTTAFVGALSAFYKKIKVAHVEAGLRSWNKYSPYPEEVNRKMISTIADFHFAPTEKAKSNLLAEGCTEGIFVTGNTVIDALLWGVDQVRKDNRIASAFSYLDKNKKTILVTGHRRESFGEAFENICDASLHLATHPDVEIVYPVHLNPNVRDIVFRKLSNQRNIHLIEPLDYPHLIWLMDQSYLVLTDSGGIQEEAPSLGKPVLVMREVTEREEGIIANTAKLVGTSKEKIIEETEALLNNLAKYQLMANAVNPYGKGDSSQIIADILKKA
jgi:UDP-N-acetylglucosamine 2-epimerase (non-hydrolysing)